jgi:hypothetical protein
MSASFEFERNVAAIFRTLGARVEHDTELAGNQIDILVTETTPTGITVRTAVECKAYRKQVGLRTTNFYAQLAYLLKERGLIERFALVAPSGFTRMSRNSAREHGLELIEYEDLLAKIAGREASVRDEEVRLQTERGAGPAATARKKRVFTVMPFSREFDDVFFLGIQDIGQGLGLVVERADLVEHSGEILDVILERIRNADVVVADITTANANVHYEVGVAHANHVPTILVMHAGGEIPFDLRGFNVILYENITRLREALLRRLRAVLHLDDEEAKEEQ